jgi:hypothetical protein
MCAMSEMQCAGVRPWGAVPWRKTYPCQRTDAPDVGFRDIHSIQQFMKQEIDSPEEEAISTIVQNNIAIFLK